MRYLLLLSLLLVFQTPRCQPVDFYREDLVFSIDSIYFTVSGTYFFRNTTEIPGSFAITYPVPRVGFQEAIDTLVVYDSEKPEIPIRLIHKDTLYFFQLDIAANSKKALSISYRQKHNHHFARYILTTTSSWGTPFEEASYHLVVPGYLEVNEFSYEPDTSSDFQEDVIYHWNKKDFMPEKDFIIRFSKKAN